MDDGACSLRRTAVERDAKHLFEDCAWLYAFFREHLFRDHTEEISLALFPSGVSSGSISVLEVGCGPGFYARRFAQRYPLLQVLGVDRSSRLVAWARWRASSEALANCRFQQGDVECLSACTEAVNAVISSRLLLVVANRRAVAAAAAVGLCISRDSGATWIIEREGLHASYCSAVAFSGDDILVSASTDHFAAQGRIYRRPVKPDGSLAVVEGGMPEWTEGIVDTGCIAANGSSLAVADRAGNLYGADDFGRPWSCRFAGLPTPSGVLIC